jgi:transposase InsO family protein
VEIQAIRHGVGYRHHIPLDSRGWLYLAMILDLISRAVVGWAISAHITRTGPG